MPTYEYECDACGHAFEEFQRMSDDPIKKCPQCKKLKVRRLISGGAGIIFKGSGFYETDYRSDSYKKSAAADKPAESGSSESKTSETKSSDTKASDTKSSDSSSSGSSSKE